MVRALARWAAAAVLVCGGASAPVWSDDGIDLDLWHQELSQELGDEPEEEGPPRPALGLYPTAGFALGPPNWASLQASAYVSITDGKTFSLYGGYGIERGRQADAHIITLGWGGVRPIPVESKQLGFHGKYLRYRRWDDKDHGVHHGLSFGTEHGVGWAGLHFEVGAARSQRNHWLVTLQVGLKFALPVDIPLTKKVDTPAPNPVIPSEGGTK